MAEILETKTRASTWKENSPQYKEFVQLCEKKQCIRLPRGGNNNLEDDNLEMTSSMAEKLARSQFRDHCYN